MPDLLGNIGDLGVGHVTRARHGGLGFPRSAGDGRGDPLVQELLDHCTERLELLLGVLGYILRLFGNRHDRPPIDYSRATPCYQTSCSTPMTPAARLVLDGVRAAKAGDDAAISLKISAGECVALLTLPGTSGPRGEASRMIDVVAGQAGASAGRILVDGRDVAALAPIERKIGIISVRDPLFGHLSVRGNVAFPLAVRHVREPERSRHVQQTLALLGLESHADLRPAALDPVTVVRACLARVMVSDPAVLLLDNALAQLDGASRREMHQLLRRMARVLRIALLLATSDRDEALMIGDRIGILGASGLHQIGPATELLDRPASEFVAVGFGEANALSGRVEWVEDDVACVRLSAGPSMEAMVAGDLTADMLCTVCVRPERVAVAFLTAGSNPASGDAQGAGASGSGPLGDAALPSTLSDMVHLGDHLRLRFRLAGGGELLVRRPASQPTAGLRPGRPALLAWQAEHAVAFSLDADEPTAPRAVSAPGRVR